MYQRKHYLHEKINLQNRHFVFLAKLPFTFEWKNFSTKSAKDLFTLNAQVLQLVFNLDISFHEKKISSTFFISLVRVPGQLQHHHKNTILNILCGFCYFWLYYNYQDTWHMYVYCLFVVPGGDKNICKK